MLRRLRNYLPLPIANCPLQTANCLLPIAKFLLLFTLLSCKSRQQADLVIHHAKIYTADSSFSVAEAMAIRDGKIIAVGSNEEILKDYEARQEENASGKIVYPGLIDAHTHFLNYGISLQNVDLVGAKSWQECIDRVKLFISKNNIPPGTWVQGRGWDQNRWDNKDFTAGPSGFPVKELLDKNFPSNPILLGRIDGHAVIANQQALDLAKLQPGRVLEGGLVETENGSLTGILVDNAKELVRKVMPIPTKEQIVLALKAAQTNCFAAGLTTVVDCGLDFSNVEQIDALQKEGILKMRMDIMLSDKQENYDHYLLSGPYKTQRLNVNAFKFYADGALGSRGACLLKPYSDKPGWQGFLLKDRKYFETILPKIFNSKFQACTHAIGDSGNRMILQVYAGILKGKNDRRWRVEHAQVVNENDFHFFGDYNIIPSVQPTHATSDMYWAALRLGAERVKGAYAYKQLMEQNNWIALGTDFPIEDISPFKTFFAAVARQDAKGFPANGFQMENELTRKQAIWGMTIWAARASFEEKEKGSLEKGKYADFILLDRDLMNCPITDVLGTKVLATYVNGEKVYGGK